MRRQSSSKHLTTNNSSLLLPKTSTPIKNKLTSTLHLQSKPKSLSDSNVSLPQSCSTPRIKKSNSFYNDHNRLYINKSRIMSQRNQSFRHRNMSFSERKRYESDRTQEVIRKRDLVKSCESNKDSPLKDKRQSALDRFHQVAANKYKKLIYGQQIVKVNKAMLEKGIQRSMSQRVARKWTSPFKGETQAQKLRGKPLVSKQLQPLLPPGNPTQLKVLNLDRLFRMREGKLTNVVPLPVAKLSQVNSRQYLVKAVKHQDKIHEAIKQYNNLLKIGQLQKNKTRLGVKGSKFTKAPTIQQLMGLKINPSKTISRQKAPLLDPQTFISQCKYYQASVKQDIHLNRRIMAGLTRQEGSTAVSLSAFTIFWQLFISRTAKLEDKVDFLCYFFLPVGQEKVELSVMKLIFEIMCKQLPPIEKLDLRADILSMEEKSKIFLQALTRVLFADLPYLEGRGITRNHLSEILTSNPDACDLLIRLLQVDS